MASKKEIVKKIKIVLTQGFQNEEDAFNFFDKNTDSSLNKKEIVFLLKKAEVSGFLRGIVASKLIQGYDTNGDDKINWQEFKKALNEM